ncbi:MAG TPA: ATP-binding protein, partial [Xanthobacteraceae bacterium]|nr:ATP-binding protein [Xanthobacteraceae bacterium]
LVQGVTDYAIYMLDTEGRVISWNSGAQRIKGYSADEIMGRHFSAFYFDEDVRAGAPQRALEIALRVGRFETEMLRRRKDGMGFWAHVVIDPIYDDDGAHIGFAKVTRDITEKRRAEEELAQARALSFQTQKMEAIGQLTGGIAHDFNNLLTAVLGSLALARKRVPDDPRITRLLDSAIQGAQRGALLTQRMLAFARRQDLKVTAIDLAELVHGISPLLQASTGSRVQIETRFPLGLPAAGADANQIELALLNLIVNARDAMPEGGKVIVTARSETMRAPNAEGLRPGRYVCLSVADTGVGMDPETLTRAVEPFFTTKGVGRGTGLGLSMVHGVAEQCGGRLVLKSRLGKGTTAEIWLPAALVHEHGGSDGGGALARVEALRPLTIVVVDDDPLVLMNTAAMLDDLGHKVFEASSGAQALRILRRGQELDLVITDQVMPAMTGTELMAAIRAERPDLPVIIATGYAEMPPGTDPNLPKIAKPFRQEDLIRALAQHASVARETVVRLRPRAAERPADDATAGDRPIRTLGE